MTPSPDLGDALPPLEIGQAEGDHAYAKACSDYMVDVRSPSRLCQCGHPKSAHASGCVQRKSSKGSVHQLAQAFASGLAAHKSQEVPENRWNAFGLNKLESKGSLISRYKADEASRQGPDFIAQQEKDLRVQRARQLIGSGKVKAEREDFEAAVLARRTSRGPSEFRRKRDSKREASCSTAANTEGSPSDSSQSVGSAAGQGEPRTGANSSSNEPTEEALVPEAADDHSGLELARGASGEWMLGASGHWVHGTSGETEASAAGGTDPEGGEPHSRAAEGAEPDGGAPVERPAEAAEPEDDALHPQPAAAGPEGGEPEAQAADGAELERGTPDVEAAEEAALGAGEPEVPADPGTVPDRESEPAAASSSGFDSSPEPTARDTEPEEPAAERVADVSARDTPTSHSGPDPAVLSPCKSAFAKARETWTQAAREAESRSQEEKAAAAARAGAARQRREELAAAARMKEEAEAAALREAEERALEEELARKAEQDREQQRAAARERIEQREAARLRKARQREEEVRHQAELKEKAELEKAATMAATRTVSVECSGGGLLMVAPTELQTLQRYVPEYASKTAADLAEMLPKLHMGAWLRGGSHLFKK